MMLFIKFHTIVFEGPFKLWCIKKVEILLKQGVCLTKLNKWSWTIQ